MRRCRPVERRRRRAGSPAAATTPRSSSCVATCKVGTLTFSHLHTDTFSKPHTLTLSHSRSHSLTLSLSLTLPLSLTTSQLVLRRDLRTKERFLKRIRRERSPQAVKSRVSTGASQSLCQACPRTVAFPKKLVLRRDLSKGQRRSQPSRAARLASRPAPLSHSHSLTHPLSQSPTLSLTHPQTLTLSHCHSHAHSRSSFCVATCASVALQ